MPLDKLRRKRLFGCSGTAAAVLRLSSLVTLSNKAVSASPGPFSGVFSSTAPAFLTSTSLPAASSQAIRTTNIASSGGQAYGFKAFSKLYGMITFLEIVFAIV
jgi:hypothetical protein